VRWRWWWVRGWRGGGVGVIERWREVGGEWMRVVERWKLHIQTCHLGFQLLEHGVEFEAHALRGQVLFLGRCKKLGRYAHPFGRDGREREEGERKNKR
jgi:hypothetical protein